MRLLFFLFCNVVCAYSNSVDMWDSLVHLEETLSAQRKLRGRVHNLTEVIKEII